MINGIERLREAKKKIINLLVAHPFRDTHFKCYLFIPCKC